MSDAGKKADWTYRIAMAAMTAAIGLGVNWIGNKVEILSGLPGQVRAIAADVDNVKKAQEDAKKVQEELKQTQSGFATGVQVGELRSKVDELTGRVGAMEATINAVAGNRRPQK